MRSWENNARFRCTGRYGVYVPGTGATECRVDSKAEAIAIANRRNYRVYVFDYDAKMIVHRNWA